MNPNTTKMDFVNFSRKWLTVVNQFMDANPANTIILPLNVKASDFRNEVQLELVE